jgi:DNA-binding MarR family transcriptional regulator
MGRTSTRTNRPENRRPVHPFRVEAVGGCTVVLYVLGMEDVAEELRAAIGRFVRATRAHAGSLPPMRAEAMGYLSREGPRTVAELAAIRGVRHQSMSRIVGELGGLGFVDRSPNPADARENVVTLTAAGRAALEADRAARRDWVAAAIEARLTPAERAMLRAVPLLLDRLVEDERDVQ